VSTTPDHYEVLGVPRDASTDDIERARKRLALIWHPDRNQSPDAAEHFDEVQKAAEVLRDPAARAAYDRDFAWRAVLSLPTDFRDRRPPAPPAAAYTPPAYTPPPGTTPGSAWPGSAWPGGTWPGSTAPGSTAPGSTAPGSTGPGSAAPERGERAHGRRGKGRPRTWPASRKARLWAGIAALAAVTVAVAGVTVAFSGGQAQPAPPPAASRPARAGASGDAGRGAGTFPLPQYTPGQAVLPLNDGRVLSIGRDITLLAAGGGVVWHEAASVSSLDTTPASSGGPHAKNGCVVDASTSGRRYDFISLGSGQQAVIENKTRAAGSMALTSNRVALPDGTIRNPCTGAVLSRAAPRGTFTTAECLTGSVLIGTGAVGKAGTGQMAWKNGHRLWQQRTRDPVICDGSGTVLMVNPTDHKISLINPVTGRARWTAGEPGCPAGCGSAPGSPGQVLGIGGTLLFSTADQVIALARGNGGLLWRKPSQCTLAARAEPSPEVLLGSCPGQSAAGTAAGAAAGMVTVAAAGTGAVVRTDTTGGPGCGPGGQWAASSRRLLVVCPGASSGRRAYQARLINW
jgi:hypothetical protein